MPTYRTKRMRPQGYIVLSKPLSFFPATSLDFITTRIIFLSQHIADPIRVSPDARDGESIIPYRGIVYERRGALLW